MDLTEDSENEILFDLSVINKLFMFNDKSWTSFLLILFSFFGVINELSKLVR